MLFTAIKNCFSLKTLGNVLLGLLPFFYDLLFWGIKGSSQDFQNETKEIINDPDFDSDPQIQSRLLQWDWVGSQGQYPVYYPETNTVKINSNYADALISNMFAEVFQNGVDFKVEIVVDSVFFAEPTLEVRFEGVLIDTITTAGTYNYTYTGTGGDGKITLNGIKSTYPNYGTVYISRVSVTRFVYMTNFAEKNFGVSDAETVGRALNSTGTNEHIGIASETLSGEFALCFNGRLDSLVNNTLFGKASATASYIDVASSTTINLVTEESNTITFTFTAISAELKDIIINKTSTQWELYIDGYLVDTDTSNLSDTFVTSFLGNKNNAQYYEGAYLHAGFTTRKLTTVETANSYNTFESLCQTEPSTTVFYIFDGADPESDTIKPQGTLSSTPATLHNFDLPNDYSQTELLSESQQKDFTTAWIANGCTVGSNTSIAPDGTLTADTISGLDTNSDRLSLNTGINPAGKTFVYSVWMKGTVGETINAQQYSNGNAGIEVVFTFSHTGWNKFTFKRTYSASETGNIIIRTVLWRSGGNTTDDIDIWGASFMEQGTVRPSLTQKHGFNVANNLTPYNSCDINAGWAATGTTATNITGEDLYFNFKGVTVPSNGGSWNRIDNEEGSVTSGTSYTIKYWYKKGTSNKVLLNLRNILLSTESNVVGDIGSVAISLQNAGEISNLTENEVQTDIYEAQFDFVPNFTGVLTIGIGAGTTTVGKTVIALGVQVYRSGTEETYYPTTDKAYDNVVIPADLQNEGYDINGVALQYLPKQGILNDNDYTKYRYPDNALLKIADTDNVRYDVSGNQLDVSTDDMYYEGFVNTGLTWFKDISEYLTKRLIKNDIAYLTAKTGSALNKVLKSVNDIYLRDEDGLVLLDEDGNKLLK